MRFSTLIWLAKAKISTLTSQCDIIRKIYIRESKVILLEKCPTWRKKSSCINFSKDFLISILWVSVIETLSLKIYCSKVTKLPFVTLDQQKSWFLMKKISPISVPGATEHLNSSLEPLNIPLKSISGQLDASSENYLKCRNVSVLIRCRDSPCFLESIVTQSPRTH